MKDSFFTIPLHRWGGLLLLVLGLMVNQTGNAQAAMNLAQSLQYAADHSSEVRKSQLGADKADWQLKELLSAGLPQVNANAQFAYNPSLQVIFFPDFLNGNPDDITAVTVGTHWGTNGSIEATQLAFSPEFRVGVKAAREAAVLNQMAVGQTKEAILLNVAQLYYSVQMITAQEKLIEANLDQVRAIRKLAELQVKNGLGRQIDVDQLTVNQLNLENQLRNVQLQYEQQMNMLKFSMKYPLDQPLVLTDTLSEQQFIMPDAVAIQPEYRNRIAFNILDKQQELNEINLNRYEASYWPTARIFANMNVQAQPRRFNDYFESRSWANFSSVGLRLSVPLYDGNMRRSQIEQVKLDILQTDEDKKMLESQMEVGFANAKRTLQVQLNNLETLRKNRTMAEEVYRLAQRRFEEGIAPVTEVVTAETSMREAQANFLTSLFQVKLAELELLQLNGKLIKMIQ
ncbi:MAG: TolC family protein [Lewinellaceae bacterium]|nr:TolC family protein [Lewinellaceae bacterium]